MKFVFTLPGGHISPILVGCEKQGIRVVDTRHEVYYPFSHSVLRMCCLIPLYFQATAVFAADAVARLSGSVGVAAVTAGPGESNFMIKFWDHKLKTKIFLTDLSIL